MNESDDGWVEFDDADDEWVEFDVADEIEMELSLEEPDDDDLDTNGLDLVFDPEPSEFNEDDSVYFDEHDHWLHGLYYDRSDKKLAGDMERTAYLNRGCFIGYPSANAIIQEIEGLALATPKGSFGHLAVIGGEGSGKTLACKMVQHGIGSISMDANIDMNVSTVSFQVPKELSERHVIMSLIEAFALPYSFKDSLASLRGNALSALSSCNVKVLIVDGADELLNGMPSDVRAVMSALKYLSDFASVSLVFIATPRVYQRVRDCNALTLDMRMLHTKDFDDDREFRKLLKSFEMFLPLRESSQLDGDEISSVIYRQTQGNIGAVSDLIQKAATEAIASGAERITVDQLNLYIQERLF